MIMTNMRKPTPFLALFFVAGLFCALGVSADETLAPEITAQGFRMDVEQQGIVRSFERIRVRIEAQERIDVLSIRERSYEVDLASTPERSHFPLFGLESRPKSKKDVTLDFQNYINSKMNGAGRYEIHIRVIDEKRQTATAVLMIDVTLEEPQNKISGPVVVPTESSTFTFQRIGSGDVTGVSAVGITWKTIDSINVTIRLTKSKNGAMKLVDMNGSDYARIETREQLNRKITDAMDVDEIRIAAANDEAAGRVFAVVSRGESYVLKVERSETQLSHLGTIVTLNGKYKH